MPFPWVRRSAPRLEKIDQSVTDLAKMLQEHDEKFPPTMFTAT